MHKNKEILMVNNMKNIFHKKIERQKKIKQSMHSPENKTTFKIILLEVLPERNKNMHKASLRKC